MPEKGFSLPSLFECLLVDASQMLLQVTLLAKSLAAYVAKKLTLLLVDGANVLGQIALVEENFAAL